MAFKQKLKNFITDLKESTAKSPEQEILPSQLVESPAVAKFKEHLNDLQDPLADREAIESIDEHYLNSVDFDPSKYELEKLPEELKLKGIDDDRQRMKRQLQAVSKKVSETVLENHPAYARELNRVIDLQCNLQKAGVICANGRQKLANAKDGFTTRSLGLIANFRKRQQLVALLRSLRTIKTLQRTDIRLREMLEEEDYPGAIQLLLECQKAAATFRHYTCISELSSKLQDTLVMIEESLDVALAKTCVSFDQLHYEKVQTAYRLLGKTQTAMDQLLMHFTSAIHNTAFTILLGYVELCSGTNETNFQKRQYLELCKYITVEMFTPCLIDLSKALWEVMKCYYKTMEWHESNDQEEKADSGDVQNLEVSFHKRYVKQKLEHGLGRIWSDVQQKVKMYLISTDLSYFKYEEFIKVLDIVNRLILIGEEFCGSQSEVLQDSIRKQTLNYFRSYHRARLDELRMFLENESWELCPVRASFSILQLQEFRSIRHLQGGARTLSSTAVSSSGETPAPSGEGANAVDKPHYGYFTKYADGSGTPFDLQTEEEESEDVMETNGYSADGQRTLSQSDSDEDIPIELMQDYVDEQTGETPVKRPPPRLRRRRSERMSGKVAPVVTNTTLIFCRLFGKYMQMMSVLKPIAFDVTICMSQLFDYYLYTVYSLFATDMEMSEINERSLSNKLRTTLKRISDNLILVDGEPEAAAQGSGAANIEDRVAHPKLSPMVQLSGLEMLHGLAARVVATESLVFLADQFQFLQPQLEAIIPPAKKAFLQQFYSQTVSTAQELRKPVYRTVAAWSINYDNLLQLMATVKWDIKDIMSQHSNYVDTILAEFEVFKGRLQEVERKVPIPKVVNEILWEHCIRLANRTFVEGYASAKKCTNEGRALMQLDFQQFLMTLEKLTDLRPIPDREYVEGYIKAYYLPEAQLEIWVRERKEYSGKQLIALVSCMAHITKKARQKLTNNIEEMDKTRR